MNAERWACVHDETQCRHSRAPAAPLRAHEQLVHESVASVELQAVAEGQRDVARRLLVFHDQPDPPQIGRTYQLSQRRLGRALIEWIPLARVERAHEFKDDRDLALTGETEGERHGNSLRSVLSTLV